jgi:glutathione peroxidase
MVQLHNELKGQGFEICAFPCNQFMKQEPGTAQEIHDFAVGQHKAQFLMFQKCDVNGPNTSPVYSFLRQNSELNKNGKSEEIVWNFGKFLVGKDGKPIKYYGPKTEPKDIKEDILKLLNA